MPPKAYAVLAALVVLVHHAAWCAGRPSAAPADGRPPRRPPMGWSSWNYQSMRTSAPLLLDTADAFATLGLQDAGYEYVPCRVLPCAAVRCRVRHVLPMAGTAMRAHTPPPARPPARVSPGSPPAFLHTHTRPAPRADATANELSSRLVTASGSRPNARRRLCLRSRPTPLHQIHHRDGGLEPGQPHGGRRPPGRALLHQRQ